MSDDAFTLREVDELSGLKESRLRRGHERRPLAWAVYAVAAVVAVVGGALVFAAIAAALGSIPTVRPKASGLSAGDLASLMAAGATLLLADFTALLAWFTRESIAATQREAAIAEAALAAANRQADIAAQSLKEIQEQAKIAERQVEATNRQAQVAQDQLAAAWRPLLAEPRSTTIIEIHPTLDQPFGFEATFANIGRGPAFVRKAFLTLGAAGASAIAIAPSTVEPGGAAGVTFSLSPLSDGVDLAIARTLQLGADLAVVALYHDISHASAWRSKARLTRRGTFQWVLADVEVGHVGFELLE